MRIEKIERCLILFLHTRLHLHLQTVGGPIERLKARDVDLMFHRIDMRDRPLGWIALCKVRLIRVIAPCLLPVPQTRTLRPEHLRDTRFVLPVVTTVFAPLKTERQSLRKNFSRSPQYSRF